MIVNLYKKKVNIPVCSARDKKNVRMDLLVGEIISIMTTFLEIILLISRLLRWEKILI